MEGIMTILPLLVLSFVIMMSFVYGNVLVANWMNKRVAGNRLPRRLVQVSIVLISYALLIVPSYRSHDTFQKGLLPLGAPSDIFLGLIVFWYLLILGLGLWQLLTDYYAVLASRFKGC
jgi:hypothetical protein